MHIQNKKSKICVGAVGVLLVALAIFGVCRLVQLVSATSAGNLAWISSLTGGTVNYGQGASTSQYTVTYDGGGTITTHAMCAEPSLTMMIGGGGVVTASSAFPDAVKIILATDVNYGSNAYSGLYQTITSAAAQISNMSSTSGPSAMFAIGHMLVGAMREGNYYALSSSDINVLEGVKQSILNWYTTNNNTDYQNYDLMILDPTQVIAPETGNSYNDLAPYFQTVVWLESNGGGGGGGGGGTGSLSIFKVEEGTTNGLSGAEFQLYKDGSPDQYIVMDSYFTILTGLEPGKYCLQEMKAPSGYELSGEGRCADVEVGGSASITFPNKKSGAPTPTTGTLVIEKYEANTTKGLVGAEFDLYNSASTSQIQHIVMNSSSETISGLAPGFYCISETKAPSGYKINHMTSCTQNYLSAGGTETIVFYDYPTVSGTLRIKKVDADTGTATPSGGASLSGTEFTVYKCTNDSGCSGTSDSNWTVYDTMTIDGNGAAMMSGLAEGDYKIAETQAGVGYVLNSGDVRTFSVTTSDYDIDLSSNPFTNTVIKGGLSITKQRRVNEDNNNVMTSATQPFQNVSFDIYRDDVKITTITTGSDGVAKTGNTDLPYGAYKIKEVANNYNVAFDEMAEQTVEVTSNGVTVSAGIVVDNLLDSPVLSTTAREASSSAENPVKELSLTTDARIIDKITYSGLTTGLSYKICGDMYDVAARTLLTSSPVCQSWMQTDGKTDIEMLFTGIDTTGLAGNSVSIIQKLYVMNNGEALLLTIHNADLNDANETLTVISGSVKIRKVDADTMTATPSGEASLAGTKFQVDVCTKSEGCDYRNNDGWDLGIYSMEINSNGEAVLSGLSDGDYRIRETQAGVGYLYNSGNIKIFSITSANKEADLTQVPFVNRVIKGGLSITKQRKINKDVNNNVISETEKFENVVFEVYDKNNTKVTTITTDSDGVAKTGNTDLPYGTYTVKEVSNANNVAFDKISDQTVTISDNETVKNVGTFVDNLLDSPVLSTTAREGNSSVENPVKTLEVTTSANIKDRVIYNNTLTNGLEYKVCGEVYAVSSRTLLTGEPSCVSWTQSAGQTEVEVPFNGIDTTRVIGGSVSIIQKLYVMNNGEALLLTIHNADLNDTNETLTVDGPSMATSAWRTGAINSEKDIYVGTKSGVSDVIEMVNLASGIEYTLKGEIYVVNEDGYGNKTLGSKVATGVDKTFVLSDGVKDVTETMDFTVDTVGLAGKRLIVYEYLYNGSNLVIEHTEITDESQTLTVMTPILETKAMDSSDNDGVIEAVSGQTIRDTISYENLEPNASYYLCGVLMDKNTGKILEVGGVEVDEKCMAVTAGGETGTFSMNFVVDASKIPGVSAVVFETLYADNSKGKIIAEHKDLDDGNQTVKVRSKIGTKAVDDYDGDQIVGVGEARIVDTARYDGLGVGTYTMKGELMDLVGTTVKSTGVKAEKVLKVTDSDLVNGLASGEIRIEFEINTKEYAGHKLVVFEELMMSKPDGEALVAEHKDKNDNAQTVTVATPKIQTLATDAADEDKELALNAKVKIKDRVAYEGLVPGTVYTLKGVLMDKKTGSGLVLGNEKKADEVMVAFKPGRDSGVEYVEFELPTATLDGKEIVVFETLYLGQEIDEEVDSVTGEVIVDGIKLSDDDIIAEHMDINDEKQTVAVGFSPKVPDTGAMEREGGLGTIIGSGVLMMSGLVGLFVVWVIRRSNRGVDFARK